MKIISHPDELNAPSGTVVSIGNFDGVHCGHRRLIESLTALAKKHGAHSAIVSFEPHPLTLLRPGFALPRLTGIERKAELLGECGVDLLVNLPTTPELLSLTHEQFFRTYVAERLQACGIVEGPNFQFGKGRLGTTRELEMLCKDARIELRIVEIKSEGEVTVSSSHIRKLIGQGKVQAANRLLGAAYEIRGIVVTGSRRGRSLGFPTANLHSIENMLPGDGVYAAEALIDDAPVPCAVNIGQNPTFAEAERKVEAHLLDSDENLYGRNLRIRFLEKVRDVIRFENAEQLKAQIQLDVSQIRSRFGLVE